MANPSVNIVSCVPFGGTFLTSAIPASWAYNQTFTVNSTQGWREVGSDGLQTQIPIGQSGPFLVEIGGEGILCSAVIGNTVFVYQDGNENGRGYTGSAVAHSIGIEAVKNLTIVATSAQNNLEGSITALAASVSSVVIPANTATVLQTTASLAAGTWLINFATNVLGSAAGTVSLAVGTGTATATFTGQSIADGTFAVSTEDALSLTFLATVTVAGTLTFTASTSTDGAGTTNAGASTGYTAIKVA